MERIRLTGTWWRESAPQRVMEALEAAGRRAWFVGGCVRNDLLGEPIGDIDIATEARPEETIAAAEAAGLRAVPTGLAFGTVTVVAEGRGFEVTTLRRDVATDGRRAVVAYADSIEDDARRRDFTINALYATRKGDVLDPVGGLADLRARRVRFIGSPDRRIREDYLRILRFFRFHAWYGDHAAGPDREALAAIRRNIDGLSRLSAERITAELLKLLSAPDPVQAVEAMAETGVLERVLPGAEPAPLARLVDLERALGVAPAPLRRLAALGGRAEGLRLSRRQARTLQRLRRAVENGTDSAPEVLGYRLGAEEGRDAVLVLAARAGREPGPEALQRVAFGARQVFPLRAADLAGRYQGAELGEALRSLEARWIESGFRLTREELLAA